MKKIASVFLILVSFFMIGIINCRAETTDTTSPTIESYSFNKNTYDIGEQITIDITAYDDVSGVQSIYVVFVDPSKDYLHDLNALFGLTFNLEKEGNGKYTEQIPTYVKEGTYELRYIEITDRQGNNTYYKAFENDTHIGTPASRQESIDGFKIQITNTKNYTNPEIETFKINGTNFEVGDEVNFEVTLKGNTEAKTVLINYSNFGYLTLERQENSNKYVAKYKITTPGKYTFNVLHIIDTNQMESIYTYKNNTNETQSAKSFKIFENGSYDFTVTGEQDLTPPTLKNIKYEKNEYIAPAVAKIYLEVSDNIENNIKEVEISFYKPNEDNHVTIGNTCTEDKDNNHYVCLLDLNQYQALGEYELNNIIIKDKFENTSFYTAEYYEYTEYDKITIYDDKRADITRKIDKSSFTLKEDLSSNVTTSTIAEDLYEKIKNSSNDATISIDTTKNSIVKKEVFDLIKGTNRTIYLETEGIVWELKGKNISISKDIDTKVTLCLLEECNKEYKKYLSNFLKKGLVIEFQNNGLLPGITKIRMKADYAFRNYIGIKDLKLYFDTNTLFDLIASGVTMKEDGYYEFYINHNSTYILTNEEIKQEFIGENKEEDLGNNIGKEESNKQDKPPIQDDKQENQEQQPEQNNNSQEETTNKEEDNQQQENNTNQEETIKENQNKNNNNNKIWITVTFIVAIIAITILFSFLFLKINKVKK